MSAEQGLVRVPVSSSAGAVRAGSVLDDDGDGYLVRWDDTGEDEIVPRGSDIHIMPKQSVRFLALSDAALFHLTFETDPITVVLHVLAESPRPMKVGQIREHLSALGLEKDVWVRHGPKALGVLPKQPGVARRTVGDTLAYVWEGDELPGLPSPGPATSPAPAVVEEAPGPPVTVPELIEASAAPEQTFEPRIVREMRAATTLDEVARLLTLPREFVAQLPPDLVAAAFRRVAAKDVLVAAWLQALSDSSR